MERYPILFSRREFIEGNGFIAAVGVSGRALLFDESGESWVEGVNPGGFAAKGASPSEALAAFCEEFRLVLFDIASEAGTFEGFKDEVEKFFHETNETALREWEMAVSVVTLPPYCVRVTVELAPESFELSEDDVRGEGMTAQEIAASPDLGAWGQESPTLDGARFVEAVRSGRLAYRW